MTRRKGRNSVHGRRVLKGDAGTSSVSFSAGRWSNIAAALPGPIADPLRLQENITECCNAYLSAVRAAARGSTSMYAVTRGGGKQPAPLQRLIDQLNAAKETWNGI